MVNQQAPFVSVCIPVYNCESYIGQAIDSVLNQTMPDLELIILDNNSSDRSLEIIRKYTDTRIRVIENSNNTGLEANWNRALAEARGKYIKILPADDFLLPDCLKKQTEVIENAVNESVMLVSCARYIVDQDNHRLLTRRYPGKSRRIDGRTAIRKIVRSGTNLLGEPGSILFKAAALPEAGKFDGSLMYVIDVDLWLRILTLGDLYLVNEPLCSFRISSGSHSLELAGLQSRHYSALVWKLSRIPCYQIRWIDSTIGILMSHLLAWGRKLFYVFAVKPAPGE